MKKYYDETEVLRMLEYVIRKAGNITLKYFHIAEVYWAVIKTNNGVIIKEGKNLVSIISELENDIIFRPDSDTEVCPFCHGVGKVIAPETVKASILLNSYDIMIEPMVRTMEAKLISELAHNIKIIDCTYCYGIGGFLK